VSQMQGAMGALQDAAATGTTAKATQRGILLDVNRTIAGEPVDTRGSYAQRSLQSTINELNAMLQRVVDATQYGKPGGIVSVEQNNSARDIYHKDGVAAEEAGVNEGAAILDALEQKILDEEAARAKKTY